MKNKKTSLHREGRLRILFVESRGNRLRDLLQAALAAGEHIRRFGLNVTGFGQGPLGEGRTNQFIDQHGEQDDVPDQGAFCTAENPVGCAAHSQGNTGLGQQGDT